MGLVCLQPSTSDDIIFAFINRSTTLMRHCPLFFSSPRISTTSPTAMCGYLSLNFKLCLSLNVLRYSSFHLRHKLSLHLCKYLALLLRSLSLICATFCSSNAFFCPSNIMLEVNNGNCTSSST